MSEDQTTTEDELDAETASLDASGEDSRDEATSLEAASANEAAESAADPEARAQQLLGQLQRVSADYQNYQKRVQRDKAKWSQDAVRSLLSALLPVLDNLDAAIAAFDGEVKDPDALRHGVVMTRDECTRQLANFKLVRIQADPGTPFNPDYHEAIMVQPAPDVERKEVLFQARAGYRLGETVLRPAQVGVRQPPE